MSVLCMSVQYCVCHDESPLPASALCLYYVCLYCVCLYYVCLYYVCLYYVCLYYVCLYYVCLYSTVCVTIQALTAVSAVPVLCMSLQHCVCQLVLCVCHDSSPYRHPRCACTMYVCTALCVSR